MDQSLTLALFAFVVAVISLLRLLREQELFRLSALKRIWGRGRGLAIYFVANIALPVVAGIVFLAQGVIGFVPLTERTGHPEIQLMVLADLARNSAQQVIELAPDYEANSAKYWHWGEFSQL